MIKNKNSRSWIRSRCKFMDHGIWHGHTLVMVGLDLEQVRRSWPDSIWIKTIADDKDFVQAAAEPACKAMAMMRRGDDGRFYYYLWLRDVIDPSNPRDMIVLAHELVHIVSFLLSGILNRNQEVEAEAYTHTYFMDKVVDLVLDIRRRERIPKTNKKAKT